MTSTDTTKPACLVCQQDSSAVPLITLTYQDNTLHICPQHLPILIHDPHKLSGILPGAENLAQADHHD